MSSIPSSIVATPSSLDTIFRREFVLPFWFSMDKYCDCAAWAEIDARITRRAVVFMYNLIADILEVFHRAKADTLITNITISINLYAAFGFVFHRIFYGFGTLAASLPSLALHFAQKAAI